MRGAVVLAELGSSVETNEEADEDEATSVSAMQSWIRLLSSFWWGFADENEADSIALCLENWIVKVERPKKVEINVEKFE